MANRKDPKKELEDLGKAARQEAADGALDIQNLQTKLKDFFKENNNLTSKQLKDIKEILKNYKELSKELKNIDVSNEDYKYVVEEILEILEDSNKELQVSASIYEELNKLIGKQLSELNKSSSVKEKLNNLDHENIGLISKNNMSLDASISLLRDKIRLIDYAKTLMDISENRGILVDSDMFQQLIDKGVQFSDTVNSLKSELDGLNTKLSETSKDDDSERASILEDIKSTKSKLSDMAYDELQNNKKSLNTLKSELGVREEINDAFEDYVKKVDTSYTKYAAIANMIPFFGKGLSKAFLQAKDISIEAGTAIRDVFMETRDPIKALAAGMKVMRGHIGMMGPIIGAMVFAFKGVHSLLSSINEITKGIQAETGLASVQAYDLYKNALSAQTSFHNQLSTLEDIVNVQKGWVNNYSRFAQLTDTTLVQISDAAKVFGYTAETAAQLQGTFMELGADESMAGNMQVAVGNLAKANKLAPGVITRDLVENSEFLATNFAGMPIEAAKAAIEVRKLGFSLSQAAKIQDHLFDVQGSLTAQMEASVAMGKLIDVSAARNYALQGETVKMMQEISKQAGTYAEFQSASVPQRMLLAKAFGMEVGELQKSLYIREKLSGLTEEEQKYALDHLKTLDGVEKMSAGQLKSEISKAQQAERFDVALSKIKNALIKAVLPLVEALVPVLETASNILSGIALIIKGIGYGFQVIGYFVEAFLYPLEIINDIIFNGIGDAVRKVGDDLRDGWLGPLKVIIGSLAAIGAGMGAFKLLTNLNFSKVADSFKSIFSMDTFKNIPDKVKGVYDKIKGVFSGQGIQSSTPTPPNGANATPPPDSGGGIGGSFNKDLQNVLRTSNKIKPEAGENLKNFLKNLAVGLKSMGTSNVSVGAGNLTPTSVGFKSMGSATKNIKSLSSIDGEALKKTLQGIASGLKSMGSGKVFLGSMSLVISSIGFTAMAPSIKILQSMASIDSESLKKTLQGIASGLRSMSSGKVFLGSLGLIAASVGFVSMIPAMFGIKLMSTVDGKSLKIGLQGLASGLISMGNSKVLIGAVAMAISAVAFIAMIPAAIGMAALGLAAPLAATGLTLLGTALSTFGSIMMSGAAIFGLAILIGSAVALGYALSLAAPAIQAFATSLSSMTLEQLFVVAAMGPALVGFGISAAAASIALLAASVGFTVFALSFSYFGSVVQQNVNPISELSKSIESLVENLNNLQNVDIASISSKLKNLGAVSMTAKVTTDSTINPNPIDIKNKTKTDSVSTTTFEDRNTSLQSNNTNAKIDRLINVMQQYVNANPQLVIEFDDGTVSKLKSKLKKTI
jgi:hypothetical protein